MVTGVNFFLKHSVVKFNRQVNIHENNVLGLGLGVEGPVHVLGLKPPVLGPGLGLEA